MRFERIRKSLRRACEIPIGRAQSRTVKFCSGVGCQGTQGCQLSSSKQQGIYLADLRIEITVLKTWLRPLFRRSEDRLNEIILGVKCLGSEDWSALRKCCVCGGILGWVRRWPGRDEECAELTAVEADVARDDGGAGTALGVAV